MELINKSFWQGKRVFVTGHTGFKGSWLCMGLHELGAIVQGYSLSVPTTPGLFNEAQLDNKILSEQGDIRDAAHLLTCMKQFKPEIVFHLAAQPLVRLSYDLPMETYSTNVMGTVSLLEAVRHTGGVKAVVNVTSDKCYENREQIWSYRETDPMGGHDPYSNSKGCAELVTRAYGQSYFAVNKHLGALASARAGNVIGGGDWAADRLVPDMIRALNADQSPIIRRPHAIRPWQHVLEPLSGYLTAIEYCVEGKSATPDSWNFAPNEAGQVDVETIARGICNAWGSSITPSIQPEQGAVHEAHLLALDATKAKRELQWHPRWDLFQTLERTVEWYRAYTDGRDMQQFTLAQCSDYYYTDSTKTKV